MSSSGDARRGVITLKKSSNPRSVVVSEYALSNRHIGNYSSCLLPHRTEKTLAKLVGVTWLETISSGSHPFLVNLTVSSVILIFTRSYLMRMHMGDCSEHRPFSAMALSEYIFMMLQVSL